MKNNKIKKFFEKHSFIIFTMSPAVVYLLIFFIIITFYMIKLALTYVVPEPDIFPTLQNFNALFNEEFLNAFVRTAIFVGIATPLQLVAGLSMALLLKRNFKGQGLIRGASMLPIAIPTLVTAIVMLMLFDYPVGVINDLITGKIGQFTSTEIPIAWEAYDWIPKIAESPINWQGSPVLALFTAILGNVWSRTPIAMLILLAGLNSISEDQYEAANTMGANGWQKFIYITIPCIIPAISSVLILRSIEVWKEFIFPFILAPSYPILGVMIRNAYYDKQDPGLAATIALVLVVCIGISTALLTIILSRLKKFLTKA